MVRYENKNDLYSWYCRKAESNDDLKTNRQNSAHKSGEYNFFSDILPPPKISKEKQNAFASTSARRYAAVAVEAAQGLSP